MIVESMDDGEFALEVVRDYLSEMNDYINRALTKKKIKNRHASNYNSKRGNKWYIIYRPEGGGQTSLHVKRPQPKGWFTWYSLILAPNCFTLFGFNKHVAERVSERYNSQLSPSEALMEMLMKTPAIIQSEVADSFYTRVNGGICIGSAYGKRFSFNYRLSQIFVELRETKTFVSDDMLYNEQHLITQESIALAVESLGKSFLSDEDNK
jgi:hypothetical protein